MSTTLTRRTVLRASAAVGATVAAHSALTLHSAAPAAARTAPGRLVVLFLRGGQDHLSTVIPYTEPAYHDARPTIAVDPADVLDLDGTFGLHPALPRLHDLYLDGRLAPVVAVGNMAANRSHFVAQDLWELGDVDYPADGHGWLARHLDHTTTAQDTVFRGVTVGNNVNRSLAGYPALGLASIQQFGLGGISGLTGGLEAVFELAYHGEAPVEQVGQQALDAARSVDSLSGSTSANRVTQAFEDTAALLAADIGMEVVTLNIGGWDTHDQMGTTAEGEMRELLAGLDDALGSFQADLDARGLTDVHTVVMTEFGRRVRENGSKGCDHGWGSCMFVLGSDVAGGRVHGSWPGIGPDVVDDHRGDIPATTDFRDVLGDVVVDVLGGDPQQVFPGHAYAPQGLFA